MREVDREAILRKYDERLNSHGDSPLTLGWTRGRQSLRFRILLERIADVVRPLTVLDFGCGFGDLFAYLQQHHPRWSYLGVDINPRLVEIGRAKFPEAQLEVSEDLARLTDCDYVVASGVFNSRVMDNEAWLRECLAAFAERARLGFSVNFLSSTAAVRDDDLYYWSVAEVAAIAQSLTKRFSIDHAYMPFEFTLHVALDDAFDAEAVVFPEFTQYLES